MGYKVKCYYCEKPIDRDSKECVPVPNVARRYAHASCLKNKEAKASKERLDQIQLENYLKQLFRLDYVHPNVQKQIKEYVNEKGFTYSGIYRTLFYYFDIMKNNRNAFLSNPTIGIVPYVYPKAREYFKRLYEAKELNKDKEIKLPKKVTVTIQPPKREPMRTRKLFTFLDEEVGNDGE